MGKIMNKSQKIFCDVSTCIYNVDGNCCGRESIQVTTTQKDEETHYCKSYERGCGFKNQK